MFPSSLLPVVGIYWIEFSIALALFCCGGERERERGCESVCGEHVGRWCMWGKIKTIRDCIRSIRTYERIHIRTIDVFYHNLSNP